MPKKYHQKSLLTKPTSSAPSSLNLSRSAQSSHQDGQPTVKSVNELISDSRRARYQQQSPTESQAQFNIQTSSSIPPALRAVLDMPAPPPPPPRSGIRGPTRLRRIPGPPPPRSWLTDSIHAPSAATAATKRNQRLPNQPIKTRIQQNFSALPYVNFPHPRSLQHATLKAMALNWQWHSDYDYDYLASLPVRVREILLSYIAIYNEDPGPNPLRVLFPADLEQDEYNEVRRLDLGNAIGSWATVKKIEKELVDAHKASSKILLATTTKAKSPVDDVPDDWDAEDDGQDSTLDATVIPRPGPNLGNPLKFQSLKHLSLAISPTPDATAAASWPALLSLTGKLSTLTSLSLAHWPQPTFTPNASTTRVKVAVLPSSSSPSVVFGGSDFYTSFDNNWREAAGIIKSLSRNLYCLKWLDLSGCGEWWNALIWQPQFDEYEEEERSNGMTFGPDWNGSWRGLEHLVLGVGWSPGSAPDFEGFAAAQQQPQTPPYTLPTASSTLHTDSVSGEKFASGHRRAELLTQLAAVRLGGIPRETVQSELWNVEHEREKYYHRKEVEKYTEISKRARRVATELRRIRRVNGGKWIEVDFGIKAGDVDADII